MRDPKLLDYAPTPLETMKCAEFLYKIDRIKKVPSSWKDFISKVAYILNGR